MTRVPAPIYLKAFLLACLLLAGAAAGHAQDAQGLGRWIAAQQAASGSFRRIEVDETTRRKLDTPDGPRRLTYKVRLGGPPADPDAWQRTLIGMTDESGPVPRERQRRLEGHRRGLFGPFAGGFASMIIWPRRFQDHLALTSPPRAARVDGREALQFDVRVAGGGMGTGRIEHLTLWFDAKGERLLRSRAGLRAGRRSGALVVTTDYERRSGLDLPRRRHTEGTVQMMRRGRSYTMAVTSEAGYDNYRFIR